MTIRITCPSCEATYTVDDGLRGKKIRCKKCEEVIAVQPERGGKARDEEDRPRPDRRVASQPVPKSPARRPRDDEDEDERPARKPARARDDDDEAPERRPASRVRASRDDDEAPRRRPSRDRDDDERPIRKKKIEKEGMSTGFLVAIGGGALLLVGLLIGGVVFALSSDKPTKTQVSAPPMGVNPANPVPVVANPQPAQEKKDDPKTLPGDLSAEALQRVKDSTVYLRVELPSGGVAQGTGFFAVEPGVIVTNAHVLGMLTADSLAPRKVIVKVHHGEPKEFELQGTVVGVDRANDLAVLRTNGNPATLPPPLQVEPASKLIETQKVWVFGYPLGTKLGKNVTVSTSAISSLRKDATGAITQVQVNGGMQPGNSGGPVANSRGSVVGVSVAIIQGTQLNFAIPGEFVTRVLAGGISRQEFGTPYSARAGGQPSVPVRMRTLDPLQRIRKVEVDLWTGAAGDEYPATDKEPQPRPGDGPRKRVAATAQGGGFTAEVPLPPLPAGQFYWAQPVIVNAAGVTSWGVAKAIPFDPALVIERKAAQLQFKAPTGPIQRTLHLKSNKTLNVFGLDEPLSISEKMEGYVLEASAPEATGVGTRTHLYLGRPRFTREGGGKVAEAPDALSVMIARLSPSYLISPINGVTNFTRPNATQESVADLFDTACNAYEVTTIPLPNRMVRPQETWAARVPMLISTGPPRQQVRMIGRRRVVTTIPSRKEVRALNLTCTYEGTRTVDGIPQGYVVLTGVVNGVKEKAKEVYGKVTGHAHVNLQSGMLSQVKTIISLEMESEVSGARLLVTNENVVDRVEGNTQNIQIPKPAPPPPPVVKKEVPAGWKEHKAKFNAFTVWLPDSAPARKENTSTARSKHIPTLRLQVTEVLATSAAKGGPVYAASTIDINQWTAVGNSTAERIDWFRDYLQDSEKSKVSGQKALKLGTVEGKEFVIERAKGVTRYRVYMWVNKYFMVAVSGTKTQVQSKDATTFLDSLTLPVHMTGPVAAPMPEKDKGDAKPKGEAKPKGKDE